MTTITSIAANSELVTFTNDQSSDTQCGMSRMLAWTWPDLTGFHNLAPAVPFWPATDDPSSNITSVNIAVLAITNSIPSSSSLPSTSQQLNTLILDTALLFSFAMLYNQIAMFKGVSSLGANDDIVAVCVGAVTAAAAPSIIPCQDITTGNTSLESSLKCASDAVATFLGSVVTSMPFGNTLATLIPIMFTPFWTLSYCSAFGDGRIRDANFYDQRYSPIVMASAFDSWISDVSVSASNVALLDVSAWMADARSGFDASTEGPGSMNKFFGTIRDGSTAATNSINTLLATNAQFERRRGSIGALSDNIHSSQKHTKFAQATLIVWIVTFTLVVVVSGILIIQKNFVSVSAIIVATIVLLSIDALWRAFVSSSGLK